MRMSRTELFLIWNNCRSRDIGGHVTKDYVQMRHRWPGDPLYGQYHLVAGIHGINSLQNTK